MSSVYSSRRSSLAEVVLHETSRTVPATPAKPRQKPVFRTVPDSPKHNRLVSVEKLDIEILTHKLQLYQLELEEAHLRFKQKRRMMEKQAADVAAAARFRDELNKHGGQELALSPTESTFARPRSLQSGTAAATTSTYTVFPPRTTSLRRPKPALSPAATSLTAAPTTNLVRNKRPVPLQLSSESVAPQEVQSAALPTRRNRDMTLQGESNKRLWRRTTIAAGKDSSSQIVLISSPGIVAQYNFTADMPPVPQLSATSLTATTPMSLTPLTPSPAEDQIRRELELLAFEEGPNVQLSRRSSVASRRRTQAAFVPDPADRLAPHEVPLPGTPTVLVDMDDLLEPKHSPRPGLGRKKSFFSRFERKNDVDSLLDLYMTDEQIAEEKNLKRKSTRPKRQTFFRRFQSSETVHQRPEKPR